MIRCWLTPFGADQPHNAERCAASGLGVLVDAATITAAGLRDACRDVLECPTYARRAREAQRCFLALPDARAAADDLVKLAADA